MKSRLFASIAVGVAVALSATGCAMLSVQATEIPYSPSDGVTVTGSAPLEVRNAMVIANASGTRGNFVAAIVNPTGDDLTLIVKVGDSGPRLTIDVPANSMTSPGDGTTDPVLIKGLDAKPGSTVKMYFQSGDRNGVTTQVPVLDGALPYYSDLVPTRAPSPSPTPTAMPTATPAPSPTP